MTNICESVMMRPVASYANANNKKVEKLRMDELIVSQP